MNSEDLGGIVWAAILYVSGAAHAQGTAGGSSGGGGRSGSASGRTGGAATGSGK
jgi:hypothetical protein